MPNKILKGADLNNNRLINLADGSAPTDGVTLQQLDGAIRGFDWKLEVIVASTTNVSLTTPGATVDGVTLTNPMRVLLKDNTAGAENGIYIWTGAAVTMTRALDADSATELSGSTVTVQRGTVNADRVYRVITDDPITLNTTPIAWAQVGGGASPYTAGNGLILTGQDFNVVPGVGLSVTADSVLIDTSVVARKYAANCVATTNPQTFAHGLGSADLTVTVRESAIVVFPDITIDATNITVDWGSAPTAGQYRVIASG
jgi:hypothetical protein